MEDDPMTPEPGQFLVLDTGLIVRFLGRDRGWLVGMPEAPHRTATEISPSRVIGVLATDWVRPLPKPEPAPQSGNLKTFAWEPPVDAPKPPTYAEAKAAREKEMDEVSRIRHELFPDGGVLSKEQLAVLKNRVRLELGIEIA